MFSRKRRKRFGGAVRHHAHLTGGKQRYDHQRHKPHQHYSQCFDFNRVNEESCIRGLGGLGRRLRNGKPFVDLTDGDDASNAYVVSSPSGAYNLCYRASGGSDSVEQSGITLTLHAGSSVTTIIAISPTSFTASVSTLIV